MADRFCSHSGVVPSRLGDVTKIASAFSIALMMGLILMLGTTISFLTPLIIAWILVTLMPWTTQIIQTVR